MPEGGMTFRPFKVAKPLALMPHSAPFPRKLKEPKDAAPPTVREPTDASPLHCSDDKVPAPLELNANNPFPEPFIFVVVIPSVPKQLKVPDGMLRPPAPVIFKDEAYASPLHCKDGTVRPSPSLFKVKEPTVAAPLHCKDGTVRPSPSLLKVKDAAVAAPLHWSAGIVKTPVPVIFKDPTDAAPLQLIDPNDPKPVADTEPNEPASVTNTEPMDAWLVLRAEQRSLFMTTDINFSSFQPIILSYINRFFIKHWIRAAAN